MELAPGTQAAAGVGEVEHSLLIAGEEDEQVFDPLEAGVILVVKTEVELPRCAPPGFRDAGVGPAPGSEGSPGRT